MDIEGCKSRSPGINILKLGLMIYRNKIYSLIGSFFEINGNILISFNMLA